MRISWRVWAFLIVSCLISGSVNAEKIANPSYETWNKLGVGSSSTLKSMTDAMGNTTEGETTTTLVEKSAEKVVVEIKASMTMAGQKMDLPAQKIEYPAQIDKEPAGTNPATAAPVDAKVTEESVTVPAGTFKCKVVESSTEANGMTTKSKSWTSDEVPGSLVKSETVTEGAMASKTTMELAKIEKK